MDACRASSGAAIERNPEEAGTTESWRAGTGGSDLRQGMSELTPRLGWIPKLIRLLVKAYPPRAAHRARGA